MDYEPGRQFAGRRNHSRSGWTTVGVSPFRLVDNRGPTRAMNRTINPSAASQLAVRRIDDCIHLLLRNVADNEFDLHTVDRYSIYCESHNN
jgi:hypothetical protein